MVERIKKTLREVRDIGTCMHCGSPDAITPSGRIRRNFYVYEFKLGHFGLRMCESCISDLSSVIAWEDYDAD